MVVRLATWNVNSLNARMERVESWLVDVAPHVNDVHDLHIWALSTEAVALTVHLVCPDGHPGDNWLEHLCHELHERHDIDHATVQIETGNTRFAGCHKHCGIDLPAPAAH